MDLSALQTLVGELTGDPSHDRYTINDINTELENTQNKFNIAARILKDTVTLTVVDGTRQYAISGLTGTPIAFTRVTHKGLELKQRDKAWFDLYSGNDWTTNVGTPNSYLLEVTDPDNQQISLYPTPQSGDVGSNLAIEYVKAHTPLASSTDTPFMSGTTANTLLQPYHWVLAYDTSARLLSRDPSNETTFKIARFQKIADDGLADIVQVFKGLEREVPYRLRGGRAW